MKLTALKVAKLNKPGRYGDGGGLYLRVAEYKLQNGKSARSKNWVFRFERFGRERVMGLGSLNTLSLAEARQRARQCRQTVLDGEDPIETRRARQQKARLESARSANAPSATSPPIRSAGRTKRMRRNGRPACATTLTQC